MTDNEIIKALEVLKSWQKLAYHNDDGTDEDSHELYVALTTMFEYINRQKAEIEELESEIDKQYEQARADILVNMADGGTSCHWCMKQHESKARKEFAEKVKAINGNEFLTSWYESADIYYEFNQEEFEAYIDKLLMEMESESNGIV